MANRFTDSAKWDDPWFRKLPCKYKAFWLFLLDKCNHAGIWKVDFEGASFHIGEEIISEEAITLLNGRIEPLKEEKWFILKFITFQYGNLTTNNNVHNSVISILQKEGLYEGFVRGSRDPKDKDKDKDKDKEKEGEYEGKPNKTKIPEWVNPDTWSEFLAMRKKIRKPPTERAKELLIMDLEEIRSQGDDPELVLRESIKNSWQGVFPLRDKLSKSKKPAKCVYNNNTPCYFDCKGCTVKEGK